MKIFIGQRVTGEDLEKLKKFSIKISKILEGNGHSVYCDVINKGVESKSPREQMDKAFREIDNSDAFLGIIKSNKKSEGMILEVGYVIAKGKRLILAVKSKIKNSTYLNEMTSEVITFDTNGDLLNKLKELK